MTQSKIQWAVDFPDTNDLKGAWINITYFDTRKQAVMFVVNSIGCTKTQAALFISKIEA